MAAAARFSRERLTLFALLTLAVGGVALCLLITAPFIPSLTWALAFAVVGYPIHEWTLARVKRPGAAAGLAVAAVLLVIVGPAVLVGWQIGRQLTEGVNAIGGHIQSGEWETQITQYPRLASVYRWITTNVDVASQVEHATTYVEQAAARGLRDLAAGVVQLFDRIRAITHATVYGTVVVAVIQGALGGLMFWFLGIPGSLLWGAAMGVLAIVPVMGAFVIWLPAAVVLAAQGSWGKALVLAAWGTIVVGLIDNLLYPMLVGKEMRLHTLPVFIAIVGGLVVFGAAGVVLGPVILAGTIAVLDILRRRTAHGHSADETT